MNPFFPFMPFPAAASAVSRRTRLQDLDARMASFLSEKQALESACPDVLESIKTSKANVQREIAVSR